MRLTYEQKLEREHTLDMLAEILRGMPKEEFDKINWTINPTWEKFQKDIRIIAEDMIFVRENTLHSST